SLRLFMIDPSCAESTRHGSVDSPTRLRPIVHLSAGVPPPRGAVIRAGGVAPGGAGLSGKSSSPCAGGINCGGLSSGRALSGGAVAPGGGGAKVPSFDGAKVEDGGDELGGVWACAAATATRTANTVKARVRHLLMDCLSLFFSGVAQGARAGKCRAANLWS